MANFTIPELTPAGTLNGTEEIEVAGGKKTTAQNINNLITGVSQAYPSGLLKIDAPNKHAYLGDWGSGGTGTKILVNDNTQVISYSASNHEFEGVIKIAEAFQFANRTAALAGGLTAGMLYHLPITGDNKVICIV